MEAYNQGKVTADAVILAAETYFQDPNHHNGTYGGVTHPEYSDEVKQELQKLIKSNGGKAIDKEKMNEFLDNLTHGKGANGAANDVIGDFNEAVLQKAAKAGKAVEDAGKRTLADIDDVIARGKANSNYWYKRIAGGFLAAGLTSILSENAKAGQAALASPHLQNAIIELEQGNIEKARALVLGTQDGAVQGGNGTNSVMEDIQKSGVSAAAYLSAEKAFLKLFESFKAESDRAKKILQSRQ
jgi:hypothetical protein